MNFRKRKPTLTVNECLNTIYALRQELKEKDEEIVSLKRTIDYAEEALLLDEGKITELESELESLEGVYKLQIEKEHEYIHQLNKEIYALNRALM